MIDFKASEESGTIYCDGCKEWASFYALTEEEFIDEVLASGWVIENGEHKCWKCQEVDGVVMLMRVGGGVPDG